MRRHELTDEEWAAIEPFLPPQRIGGKPRVDDRRLLNAMVFRSRTGLAWRDLPERYGPWQTVYTRFRRWATDGTFDRLLAGVQARAEAAGAVDWLVSIDATIVRAHQHAAGGRRGATDTETKPSDGPVVG
jgi:transposase